MSEITRKIFTRTTFHIGGLVDELIEKYEIKVENYSEDDLDFFLEDKFMNEDVETLVEYADMCCGEETVMMYYLSNGNPMPDLNLSKKEILTKILIYTVSSGIWYKD